MGGCSAVNCTNSSKKGVRMFKFPSEINRRKKWVINTRRDWVPGPYAQLCIDHFEESQFEQNRKDGWKRLKQDGVPTLFKVPNPPETLSMKRIKGIGCPKPNTVLSSHLNAVNPDFSTMPKRCSIAGCKSNYASQKGYHTVFSLPKNEPLRSRWLQSIPTDFKGLKNPLVCIKHFKKEDIISVDEVLVKGELKKFPRKVPKYKDGSVPTIFLCTLPKQNRKKRLKEEITDNGSLCTNKNACMNVEESDDCEDEGSISSSEIAVHDSSVSISNSLASNKPGDSTSNACITHITLTSADSCSRIVMSEDASNTIQSEDTSLTPISADFVLGTIKPEIDQTETDSNEFLLTAAKSNGNFSDDNEILENVQNGNLFEIPDRFKQTGHITHREAFSAAGTLLRYVMNQDEVNAAHVNFILNYAQKVKEKIK